MVYLDTDKQTCADLSITESVYDEQPLCSLFLKTETKQGKSLMLEWIMYPSVSYTHLTLPTKA